VRPATSVSFIARRLNRPPKPPPDLCGPYFQLKSTTAEPREWLGSALILHRGGPTPTLTFRTAVQQDVVTLYEDIWGMTAIRVDLAIPIPDGKGDERIDWKLEWPSWKPKEGAFHIPRWEQRWRGGFFSCAFVAGGVSRLIIGRQWLRRVRLLESL
jgi:hypothetical protein